MHQLLKRYIQTNLAVEPQKLEYITSLFKPQSVKRNTVLLTAGEICKQLYFINKGSMRTYYLSPDGKERTRYIALEGIIGTVLASFITQKPSFEFADALEDTELLSISHKNFYRLIDEMPEWNTFYCRLLEFAYVFQNTRIENLVTLSAKERYDDLLKDNPEYIQRLPNHVLASYLDMSQETLSRLKSK